MSQFIIVVVLLGAVIAVLLIKIYLMKRSAREISCKLEEKLSSDTNTLIDISSGDRDMRYLAYSLNSQLKHLRDQRQKFVQGNTELKKAVTNISHDLRTPLTAICGYLDMLEKTADTQEQARYIGIIKDRTALMKHLTEELLRYSVIVSDEEVLQTERVYVNQVLEESIIGFYPALTDKGIAPKIELTGKRIERCANREALSRVFANLLSNAVKYSDGDLDITLSDSGEITFSNTAKALSAVEVERLFDRCYTVEAAHHSTGLGLSIARVLAERMGGTISAAYLGGRIVITVTLG